MRRLRPGAGRRWTVVAATLAALVAAPVVVAARSVPDLARGVDAADLRRRVLGSAGVAWSGYAEATGRLGLPHVRELHEVTDVFSGTSRLRVWWGGPRAWRVDALDLSDETGVYATRGGTITWDSRDRRAVALSDQQPVRLPRAADLVPAPLARRLLASLGPADVLRRGGSRRVAGVETVTLVVEPADPRSTVGRVEVAVEPRTALPLAVTVTARGAAQPALSSRVLDLTLAAPPADVTRFTAPPGVFVVRLPAGDLAVAVDRYAPYALPADLAGLLRRARAPGVGGSGGVGTYGEGLTLFAVLPLPSGRAVSLLRDLRPPVAREVDLSGGVGALVRTPLLSALVVRSDSFERGYVLAGAVTPAVLTRAATELLADPPPLRLDGKPR